MKPMDDSVAAPQLARLRQIHDDALSLEAAYPGYYDMRGMTQGDVVSLASQRLIAYGIAEAMDRKWVDRNVDSITLRVLAKECLLHRLVELLNSRDDINRGLDFARSRGCDECEAMDAVEDALVALLQRGHGLKTDDTLLRFFRTILWEKTNDLIEKKITRSRRDREYAQHSPISRRVASELPAHSVMASEARDLLISSIQGLEIPVEPKASLFLKYGAGWTSKEIASVLGKNSTQVDTMNHRTRRQVRCQLSEKREQFAEVSNISVHHAARAQAVARKLTEKREGAALVLHAVFSMPAEDVIELFGISEFRLRQLVSLALPEDRP